MSFLSGRSQITFTEKRRKQSSLNKRTKYDNSTLNKINRPVTFAACSPSHPARVRLLYILAREGAGGSPAPDGGYPGGNTAEGQKALFSLTSGTYNTAVGFLSLASDNTGSFNTATGAGALLSNTTGNNNNAYGVTALLSNTTGPYNNAFGTGALASNTTGDRNTAIGEGALLTNTTGFQNIAIGVSALRNNATGHNNIAIGQDACSQSQGGQDNTAIGDGALQHNTNDGNTAVGSATLIANTIGGLNTAVGGTTMPLNTTGSSNTAIGLNALFSNVSGDNNTAIGRGALGGSTGGNNIALGNGAGSGVTTASSVICIGAAGANASESCYIGNIFGKIIDLGTAADVGIDATGKLGTVPSSRRFKRDIKPMDTASEAVLALKPVTFHYKSDAKNTPCFGLIAEEVAAVDPALVVRDKEGKPFTVRYAQINAMLLNEFLKEHKAFLEEQRKVQKHEATITELKSTVAQQKNDFQATVAQLTARLDQQASQIQKVSGQLAAAGPSGGGLEATKPAPQVALNNP